MFTGPAMGELFELVKEVFGAMEVGHAQAREIKGLSLEAGLEEVQESIIDVPLSTKNINLERGRKSAHTYTLGAKSIVAAARQIFRCAWSAERLDALESSAGKELQDHGGVSRAYYVWARKPLFG
jgi:hypothetical protein